MVEHDNSRDRLRSCWTATEDDTLGNAEAIACAAPNNVDELLQRACAMSRFTSLEEIKSRPLPECLVEGLIVEKTLAALYGPSGVGKSFLALDLAMAVAAGGVVWEREASQGLVIYIVAEGEGGFPARVQAWETAHAPAPRRTIIFLEMPVDLSDEQQVRDFIGEAQKVAMNSKVSIALVVVDTLARCMSGQENSTDDMKLAVEGADNIRRALDAAVLLVHHSKKDDAENMRGSGVLWASLQTVINVRKGNTDGELIASVKKQKDGAEDSFLLALDHVEYAIDDMGNPKSSLAVRFVECGGEPQRTARNERDLDRLSPSEQAMLDIVVAVGSAGISRPDWHAAGAEKGVGSGRTATRNEAIRALCEKRKVVNLDGYFYASPSLSTD